MFHVRLGRMAGLVVLGQLAVTLTAQAGALLPTKDSGNAYATYALGYSTVNSSHELFVHTGDSIWRYDADTDSFTDQISGLRSSFGGPARISDMGFAPGPDGEAMVMMGQAGGALLVNLSTGTRVLAPNIDSGPGDTGTDDNLFSAASRADGKYYATYVAPDYSTFTSVYFLNPGDPTPASFVVDPPVASPIPNSTADYSGSMTFDTAGNLYVGVFSYLTGQSFPIGTAGFFRIDAADLDTFESTGTLPGSAVHYLGGAPSNGNGSLVVDLEGNLYFSTSTGIGRFRNGVITSVVGDVLFNGFPPVNAVEGLAYDPATNSLAFGQYNQSLGGHELAFLMVPEPTSALLLVIGVAGVMRRRGR
ncbi:MAG: PEP-CTERM sorting domain-containing protein [Phycisphaeraceae bacterium]|nr:PEP-CTERM sorting domain-containing protein [Phycisphaeraceae bacterium]